MLVLQEHDHLQLAAHRGTEQVSLDDGFLRQYHARSEQGLESFDHSVFVVRDTVERIVSVYKNKFVQRSGNKDIFANYAMRTGTDPELASFEDLVRDYLRHPFRKLDPHVWSQISHLDPAVYSDAILMDDLHASMTTIVGTELADRYFLGKVNSTSCRSVAVEDAWSIPSRDLHAFYLDRKVMPATASFITPALRERVREVYAEDFELYDAVRSAARRTARPCSGLPVAS